MLLLDAVEKTDHVGADAATVCPGTVRIWKSMSHSRLDMPV